ncbi:MAG: 1-acyl-sn-glycerol-3-phosphate acyltransferase [Bacteroidia bacterium]|nr:1-acyl-sn-glycerol-3-phosphate acyltransferase [Bacteroidia bacterium]
MKKILGWIFTPFHALFFILIILIFHVLQIIALRLLGYHAHKKVVDAMEICMILNLQIVMGLRLRCNPLPKELSTDKPLIIISNHQSMFDIPIIGWVFRKYHPKYISKRELAHGIPSISYNIRHGGSIAINRGDAAEAVQLIADFGKYLEKNNFAGCIFPEGTRSRNGVLKPFKTTGTIQLLNATPNAQILPLVISGSWETMRYNSLPTPYGIKITLTPLPLINRKNKTSEEIAAECEQAIKQEIEKNKNT